MTEESTEPNRCCKPRKPRRHLGAVIPQTSEAESDAAWGDHTSNEARLREEVPPHFGKL